MANGSNTPTVPASKSIDPRHSASNRNTAVARVNPPVGKPSRKEVEATFTKFASLIHASNRPLPHRYGDGKSAAEEEEQTGIRADLTALRKGGFLKESIETLLMFAKGKWKGGPTDDKTMIVCIHSHLRGCNCGV